MEKRIQNEFKKLGKDLESEFKKFIKNDKLYEEKNVKNDVESLVLMLMKGNWSEDDVERIINTTAMLGQILNIKRQKRFLKKVVTLVEKYSLVILTIVFKGV